MKNLFIILLVVIFLGAVGFMVSINIKLQQEIEDARYLEDQPSQPQGIQTTPITQPNVQQPTQSTSVQNVQQHEREAPQAAPEPKKKKAIYEPPLDNVILVQ